MQWVVPLASAGTFLARMLGCVLMGGGAALAVWLPLSLYKPLGGKKMYGVLFGVMTLIIASVKMGGGSEPAPASAAPPTMIPTPPPPANPRPVPAATKPVAVRPAQKSAPKPFEDDLSEVYADHANGYSIRFPSGWIREKFDNGDPWIMDATDGRSALISIGFSPLPAHVDLSQLHPEVLASHISSQSRTRLEGQGRGTIDGRPCLWFRYSSPLALTSSSQIMTMVHYFLPLRDGRMLELRFASAPEQFAKLGPLLRKSVATFKLIP